MSSLFSVKDVSLSFGSRKVFSDISLDINRGEICTLLGSSGLGKTTLIKLLTGQVKPDSGVILFNNYRVDNIKVKDLYKIRKKMSVLFQHPALFSDMTVFENVAFPLFEHTDLHYNVIRSLVLMRLEMFGLRFSSDYMPLQLSGGMNRRVAFSRSTVLQPDIIFLDEPFVGQDPVSVNSLIKSINFLNKNLGITCFMVSHNVEASLSISDKVFLLSNNKIIDCGTPEEFSSLNNQEVHSFLYGGSSSDNNQSSFEEYYECLLC